MPPELGADQQGPLDIPLAGRTGETPPGNLRRLVVSKRYRVISKGYDYAHANRAVEV